MQYFHFSDEYGEHRISTQDAQDLLHVTRRTIQNYYHPEKRDPGRWAYIEAAATGRLIPEDTDLRLKRGYLFASTGFRVKDWELHQIAFAHSMKDNTIAGQQREIERLKSQIADLQTEHDKLLESTRPEPANVIPLTKEAQP